MRRFTAAFSLISLVACAGRPDPELARAVREYDDALIRAYAGSDAAPMGAVAGAKEAGRVRVLIDLKTGSNLVLESRLESFEVTSSETKGDRATVETREQWRYHDRPLRPAPGAAPGREIASRMTLRYVLVRDGGRWKVDSVATLANEPLTPRP